MGSDWKRKDFNIIHQNIRGLFSKKDQIADYLTQNDIKLCAISETLLNDSIPTSFVDISGYCFERRDRGSSGGGGWSFSEK